MTKIHGIITNEDIEQVIWLVVDNFLIPKFRELNMNASGQWLEALSVKGVNNNRGEIWGKDYTYYLQHGRASGTMPPVSAIEKWVGDKFGIYGREANQRAWAIAKKIQKEGTSYYPQGTDLIEVLYKPECQTFIQTEMNKIYKNKLPLYLVEMLKKLKNK